ncbi:MAG: [Fe-Fe] hydrogenase large subunit C-terminal domain-containing protein [Chloroflexota bacterium]
MVGIVATIKAKCKRCYTCVRSCPARAIKVEDGQAQVVAERCIACGNCYKVCSQRAKSIKSSVKLTWDLLRSGEPVIACLAPSFPAAFPQATPGQIVSAVRALGYKQVLEVAFGAQLVAREYAKLFRENRDSVVISTPCPAVVAYVQKYVPSLVPNLAPIVSPAIALGRVISQRYRPGAHTVFIGPCVAKKEEIADPSVANVIDVAQTFVGLKRMLAEVGIVVEEQPESAFDGLPGGTARIFPVSGGLLRTAALQADILDNDILVVEGKDNAINVLQALARGELQVKFVDILFCSGGCIDGPTLGGETSLFARKEAVADFVRQRLQDEARAESEQAYETYADIDLSRRFVAQPVRPSQPTEAEIGQILERIDKRERSQQLNCGACGYPTCREKAIAVYEGLAEIEMCLPWLIDQLQTNLRQLQAYQKELEETHAQLVHSEKLASVGQLAAGIAHELNNPLGTILIYSHLLLEGMDPDSPLRDDLKLVVEETTRCKGIVAGLLDFARQREVLAQATDLNTVISETLAGMSRQPFLDNIRVVQRLDRQLPSVLADPNQLREVLTNMVVNAAEAMPGGGTLTITTAGSSDGQSAIIHVADTGLGISEEGLKRLFTPFYTTKPKGTGLGLAIAYGIVKMHRGAIDVSSKLDEGTTFTITLPVRHEEEMGEVPQDRGQTPYRSSRQRRYVTNR